MYIQKSLTTTPYELPGISWELTPEMEEKFRRYRGMSKLVLNADETAIVDIVEDTERRAAAEQLQRYREERDLEADLRKRQYVPSASKSAAFVARMLLPQLKLETQEDRLAVSGLYPPWAEGKHEVGEICNTASRMEARWNQTWECFSPHDNAVYPDIAPGNAAWFTFWRPLHGVSPETARFFVQPTGAHDIYKAGECVVWSDGETYRAKSDTSFSPADAPTMWALVTQV